MRGRAVAKPRHNPPVVRAICVLSIAGSDSSGGAGIQADLRTFAALGVHGLSAVTAITAQNTARVRSIHRIPIKHLQTQLDAAAAEFDIAAVKIGMLGSAAAVTAAARFVRERTCPVVLDPVLISSSGTRLLPAAALGILIDELIPLAHVLTPNLPEAIALLGSRSPAKHPATVLARELLALGPRAVLLKGGHSAADPVCDYLAQATGTRVYRHRRLPYSSRGTGCTLSAAIAAYLACGMTIPAAVAAAERHLQRVMIAAYLAGNETTRLLGPLTRR